MRAFHRAATIAALVFLCALTPACITLGAEVRTCASPENVAAQVRASSSDIAISFVIGVEAANLSAAIAAATGSAVPQDSVYLLAREAGSPVAYLAQFEAGCAMHHGRFPIPLIQAWIKGSTA